MKIRLSDIAQLAEVIGAAAIVVSLIYVGVQVQDSTRAVRSATANETTNAISLWYESVGSDPQRSEVFRRGLGDPDSLSQDEWAQFVYLFHALALKYLTAYYLSREGTLDYEITQSLTATLVATTNLPGFFRYWEQRGNLFEPGFRAYVEEIFAGDVRDPGVESLYLPNQE